MKLPRVNFPRFISQFMTLNEKQKDKDKSQTICYS